MLDRCKIYGPYTGKDGRQRISYVCPDKTKRVKSYPRYLLEKSIGRVLNDNEDVHHKDGDFTNNKLDNLEIIDHAEHSRKHSQKYFNPVKVICQWCNMEFILTPKQQRRRAQNAKRNKGGLFCSKSCSGKYGKHVQLSAKKETS